jgi:hypothetical protein
MKVDQQVSNRLLKELDEFNNLLEL